MIRAFVDYSLRNKLLVLAVGILLLGWGAISFKNLPVEAYPDVANNYVQVITQWPGRAGEEVEQQVTIPIEVQMAGIPHLTNVRSISEFGLSVVTMNFDDESNNDWNRQKVLERLSMVTLPGNLQPAIGPDYSPVGQLYWYTLTSTNPQYDLMELKSLEDWVIEKQLKSVPNVIGVSSFGGLTREYQVQVDPNNWFPTASACSRSNRRSPTTTKIPAAALFKRAASRSISARWVCLAIYGISMKRF
jgi:heavy metal efflux system protein